MINKTKIFLLLSFLQLSLLLNASGLFYNIDVLSTENGLSDNYVECILQDYEGFVWIATHNGLQRSDGLQIKTYKGNGYDTTSLSSNFIYTLFEDSQKRLWVGTNYGGLLLYNRDKDNFKRYLLKKGGKINNERNVVRGITEDNNGMIWFATLNGIGRLNPTDEKIKWFTKDESPNNYATGKSFISIIKDNKGNIVTGDVKRGRISIFSHKTRHFITDSFPEAGLQIRALATDSQENIWIGDKENGIYMYSQGKIIKHFDAFSYCEDVVKSNQILNFYTDKKQNIWVGRVNGDILRFNQSTGKFECYPSDHQSRLSAKSISCIYEDNDGNIWLGTHGGGVNIINRAKNYMSYYTTENNNTLRLNHNMVSSFLETEPGVIWVATDGGGINIWNTNTDQTSYLTVKEGLSSNYILDMQKEGNSVWVASWGGGIMQIDAKTAKVKRIIEAGDSDKHLSLPNVKGLLVEKEKLLVPTHGAGLNIINSKTGKVSKAENGYKNFSSPEWGNKITKDSKGIYWIASDRGAYSFDGNSFTLHKSKFGDKNTLSSDRINDILISSHNTIFFGTEQGLDSYNISQKFISRLNSIKKGLPSGVKAIIEDKKGRIWLSSQKQLSCWYANTDRLVSFGPEDGILPWQFMDRSAYVDSKGNLYFGSLSGFVSFNPDSLLSVKAKPKPHITDFFIYNEKIPIKKSDEVKINYNDKRITFTFSAINFVKPDKTKFKYYLEGFDSDWNYSSITNSATYTNINAGTYTFYVKASIDNLNWSEPTAIKLIISPPWWSTFWFRTVALLSIALLAFIIYWSRINNIRQINALLEHKVKVRTQELLEANKSLMESKEEIESQRDMIENKNNELELFNSEIIRQTGEILIQREKIIDQKEMLEKNNHELDELNRTKDKFFSIIAHDLKNPLNVLIGLSDLIISRFDAMDAAKMLKMIQCMNESSKNLYDLLLNLLEWSRSQTKSIKYNPVVLNIAEVFDKNISLLKDSASKKEIKLIQSIKSPRNGWADQNMIMTVVRNLASNAIKFTPKGGEITLIAKEKENMMEISVQDNGIGMSKEQIDNLFMIDKNNSTNGTENEKGTGLGLIISKEFIEINGGKINVESKINKGTRFYFTIPFPTKGDLNKSIQASGKN